MAQVELRVGGQVIRYNPSSPRSVRRMEAVLSGEFGTSISVADERRGRGRRLRDFILPRRNLMASDQLPPN